MRNIEYYLWADCNAIRSCLRLSVGRDWVNLGHYKVWVI